MTVTSFDIAAPLPTAGQTVLLEASAGTGKTWTIAALVTRMIADGRARIDQILVVTYTRAASAELRDRVRRQLVHAHRALTGDSVEPSALITVMLHGEPEELGRRRERLADALAAFDAATIVTIHSFCQLVLNSLGVAADVDHRAELSTDTSEMLAQVTSDLYLARFADLTDPPLGFAEATTIADVAMIAGTRIEPTDPDPGSPDAVRVEFAAAVRAEMARRKQAARCLSFDDLLHLLADTLADPTGPARDQMRRRWPVVLIDEFQDTDPTSWQVFDRAFTGRSAMVLIGDPKQAIYGFRGGDVFAYLAAASTVTQQFTLDTNHRSDAGVVDRLHTLLAGVELGDPRIVVHPITAALTKPRLAGSAHADRPVRLRGLVRADLGLPDKPKLPSVGPVRARIAADLAADVKGLLTSGATFDGRPIQPGDVAVLAARHAQLREIRDALRVEGVPAVLAGTGSVFATPAAGAWVVLLDALEAPNRVDRVRVAAIGPFFARTAQMIAADDSASDSDIGPATESVNGSASESVTDEVADRLRAMIDAYATGGPAALLQIAIADGMAARQLGRVGGERDYTDIRQIGELLHAEATGRRLGIGALRSWLREQIALAARGEPGERTRRLDSDDRAVQLVTIHASKGLQYPVVYLPSLADRHLKAPPMPMYHDIDGNRCVWVGVPKTPGHQAAVDKAMAEDAGESLRLMYVALTRAQSQVVAWWATSTTLLASPLHRVLMRTDPEQTTLPPKGPQVADREFIARLREWESRGAFALERAELATVDRALAVQAPPQIGVRTLDRDLDTSWRRTSYTALSRLESVPVVSETEVVGTDDEQEPSPGPAGMAPDDVGADQVAPMSDQPAGALFGSLVHAVLEHADPAAADLESEMRDKIEQQLMRWPAPVDVEALAAGLARVVTTPLGPLAADATLASIGTGDRLAELEFELPLAGGDLGRRSAARLGDLAPLLTAHLPAGDPVRAYADQLANPELAQRTLRGYLTGSIDVVLRVGGPTGPRYLVVDYKTNRLGSPGSPSLLTDYRPEALAAAMAHSDYPLQALLYAVTLHRFLRWRQPGYDPEIHLGGVLYLYLRGMAGPDTPVWDSVPSGVFSWRPPIGLVEAVSALLDGEGGDD